jgi:hypothetical protein
MKLTPWLFLLLSFFGNSFWMLAGNDGFSFGPRSMGTGQISGLFTDVWAVHNNIGSLGWLNRGGVTASFENRYNSSSFNQIAFAAATTPAKYGTVGFGVSRFGSDVLNQTRAQVGWAKVFGIASIGIQAQWYQVQAAGYPTRNHCILNFGGHAKLTPKLSFAASVSNFTQTKASDFQNEILPVIAKAGISFTPVKSVLLLAEVQKDLDQNALVKAGIEYEIRTNLWLRTGFTTEIQLATGGIGFKWRDLQLDYSVSNHPQLGWSQGIGLQMNFGNEKVHTRNAGKL